MKLNLRGHEDRYAIEQSLLAFFPEERPVYEGDDGDSHAEVTLHEGNVYATGVTTLTYGGKTARGEARVRTAGVSDAYERERLRQRALKLSFFRAARDVTGVTPSWGALTGIRPAKLVRTMLEEGYTPARADRELRDVYCVSPARRRLALESADVDAAQTYANIIAVREGDALAGTRVIPLVVREEVLEAAERADGVGHRLKPVGLLDP